MKHILFPLISLNFVEEKKWGFKWDPSFWNSQTREWKIKNKIQKSFNDLMIFFFIPFHLCIPPLPNNKWISILPIFGRNVFIPHTPNHYKKITWDDPKVRAKDLNPRPHEWHEFWKLLDQCYRVWNKYSF